MKKIINVFLLLISITILSGCTLAQEPDLNIDTENHYIPAGIVFNLSKGQSMTPIKNVSDYFFITFHCEDMTVFDNCFSTNVGKSVESGNINYHMHRTTVNGVEEEDVKTITKDLTLYVLKDSNLWINHAFIFENEDGDTKEEGSYSTNFSSGITISGEKEGKQIDGTKHIINYTFHYETIDLLESVTIKQFDKDDNLLEEVTVLQDNLLDELVLNEHTDYYFIIEEYMDEEGNTYQNRIYHDAAKFVHHLYKFTNDYGFLEGDRLIIKSPTE